MSSEILINVRPSLTRVAYVENKILTDLKIERTTAPTLVGSIFKGKVLRVLPGMQAAFVDLGLDRAAFLYVGDVQSESGPTSGLFIESSSTDDPIPEGALGLDDGREENFENKFEGQFGGQKTGSVKAPQIQDLLTEGQILLVQVAKDPLGTKGARITTHASLPGRHVVYMPSVEHLGVSRKIEDEAERERLRGIVEKLKPSGGVIVRTAGEGASEESLASDLEFLNRVWKEIQKNYEKRKTPGLVYSEVDVELRALRDMLSDEISQVIVDEPKAFKKIVGFVTQFMPQFKNKIVMHKDEKPLFDQYDIDIEISRSLERKIWLKSGGYIVIDEAEALVVVDVNTGRYVGKKDLEDTILKTNLEACAEICHQLRIRNCGGIIIIDFIDMEKEVHREKVLGLLQEELAKDRARTVVSSMSSLGLVEMTRKRIRPSLVSTLCRPCPYCEGRSYIKQNMTIANEIFRTLEREGPTSPHSKKATTVVHCHADVADCIYEDEAQTLEFIENKLGHSIVFKVEPNYHLEQFEIYSV